MDFVIVVSDVRLIQRGVVYDASVVYIDLNIFYRADVRLGSYKWELTQRASAASTYHPPGTLHQLGYWCLVTGLSAHLVCSVRFVRSACSSWIHCPAACLKPACVWVASLSTKKVAGWGNERKEYGRVGWERKRHKRGFMILNRALNCVESATNVMSLELRHP